MTKDPLLRRIFILFFPHTYCVKEFFFKLKSVHDFWKRIWSREIAASLAFYVVTGFAPALCLLIFFLGKIFPEEFIERSAFFGAVSDFVRSFNTSAKRATINGGAFFAVTSAYSATNLFYRFKRCGEILYGYESEGKSLVSRLVSLLFVGITVVFFAATGFSYMIVNTLFGGVFLKVAAALIAGGASFVLLVLLNLLVCPYRLSVREVYKGALVTLFMLSVITVAFGIYVDRIANFEKIYGVFSGFFSFVVYAYFLMQAFTFGVAFNILRLGRLNLRKKRRIYAGGSVVKSHNLSK